MGFIREKYSNNQGGLTVVFQGSSNTENYFAGDSIQDALEYFNMYIQNGQIFIRTNEELSLEEIGVKTMAEATQLRQELDDLVSEMTDEEATERAILFANWKANTTYAVGARVRYGGRVYKVLQQHTSQEGWEPSRAPSLFAQVLVNEETGEPEAWQQPDSTNPYMYGDKVIYNNKVYESVIDFNVWNPEEYPQGWNMIQDLTPAPEPEPEPEVEPEPETPTIPEWVQPDASNAYNTGDQVMFNGQVYESTINNNVWSPEAYPAGWTLIE